MSDALWPYWIEVESGDRLKLEMLASAPSVLEEDYLWIFSNRDGGLSVAYPSRATQTPSVLKIDTSFDWKDEEEG